MSAVLKVARSKLTAIDLFSGCGGLSLGLKRAGFAVVAAVESDELASSTYKLNHPRVHLEKNDIRDVDPVALRKKLRLKKGELALLAGCPPCQGFSTLRTLNGAKLVDDPKNDLVLEFTRFVSAFKPCAIMIENVPGLLADKRLRKFGRALKAAGYRFKADIFDAADYGAPQHRRRMILIASRKTEPKFADPVSRKRTVRSAIGRLASPQDSDDPVHNYTVRRAPKVMEIVRRIPRDGGSRSDLPDDYQLECHKKLSGFHDIYGRLSWSGPATTITSGCINPSKGRFLHPEDDRAITLREAALLQGFPISYRFDMSRGRYPAAEMIGNAFPPIFAQKHAVALREAI